ncbi:MAG: TfuA-like protein [Myxococcota bacterium]
MDAPKSIAVFLGPSVDRRRAAELVDASVYPPARMGDVYRLIASGVRIIVLIDGVFHGAPAVWHRELREAMAQGICVIGAASMGALRAAELHSQGMLGVGTIFEWYRDGVIDGDDEVALLHADADDGYRALSQPLVNIRHRLEVAVSREVLTQQQAVDLVGFAKGLAFTERSHARMMASEVARRWPQVIRTRLLAIFEEQALDLKRSDAECALEFASARLAHVEAEAQVKTAYVASRYYYATSKRKRGFLHPEGRLVSGETLWGHLASDRTLVRRSIVEAAQRFYLNSLAEHWGVACPVAFIENYWGQWQQRHGIEELPVWLRANGLTDGEYHELFGQHALVVWMLGQGPQAFDLDFSLFSRLPALWAYQREHAGRGEPVSKELVRKGSSSEGSLSKEASSKEPLARAAMQCFLAAWARLRGISCPKAVVERFVDKYRGSDARLAVGLDPEPWRTLLAEDACGRWIVHEQPYRFGYTGWSPLTAVLEQLQLSGRAAQLVAQHC